MKLIRKPGLLLAFVLVAGLGKAQDGTPTPVNPKPQREATPNTEATPILEHSRKIGRPVVPALGGSPGSVDQPALNQSTELKTLIDRFQAAREQYLLQQKQILQQLRQSSDEQRAALRDQMKDNLDAWRELQLEFRSQLKDRAVELRRELQSQLREVVDEGRKEGGDGRRRE